MRRPGNLGNVDYWFGNTDFSGFGFISSFNKKRTSYIAVPSNIQSVSGKLAPNVQSVSGKLAPNVQSVVGKLAPNVQSLADKNKLMEKLAAVRTASLKSPPKILPKVPASVAEKVAAVQATVAKKQAALKAVATSQVSAAREARIRTCEENIKRLLAFGTITPVRLKGLTPKQHCEKQTPGDSSAGPLKSYGS